MYRTVSTDFTQDPDFKYDMFVFFSPSGITSLFKNFPNFVQGDIKIGCFGPTAVKAAEEAGLTVNIAAPNEKSKSMAEAMDLYFKENADK
jgi:uroporphyrinogen-III synthase